MPLRPSRSTLTLRGVALVFLAGLFLVPACGGGGGGGSAPPDDPSLAFATDHATLSLDAEGRLTALRLGASGRDLTGSAPQAILELVRGGVAASPTALREEPGGLVASFDALGASARLAVEERPGHLVVRVIAVEPADVEALRLRFLLAPLASQDAALNGAYDDDLVVCLRSLTAATRCAYSTVAGAPQPEVEWTRELGIVGGAAALLATPRAAFFDAVAALEREEGLPSPHFDGVPGRLSQAAATPYLFLTYYRDGDLPALLEYAGIGEFGLLLWHRNLWRESAGTYGIDTTTFPGGLPSFIAASEAIHAAGLGVGVHVYGPSVSENDPLVSPVPHDGLLAFVCPTLATAVTASDGTLELAAAADLPDPAAGGFPGTWLRVGDEIVRYAEVSPGPPTTFVGCERGALGTTASSHPSGTPVRHLASTWGLFLVDPDGPLRTSIAANLAAVANAADLDMVYFDGCPAGAAVHHFAPWYYTNRLLPAYDAAFDHPVLVQTSMGPGRQLDWHLVPRSASADGHGDIKAYLDLRTPSIQTIRRGFTVPDVGWYGFDAGRPPDYLEYVATRCLGWGCPLSIQTHRVQLESDPRARETMEIIGRYERCKQADVLPQTVRDALLVPGNDFRLLEDEAGAWSVFEAAYALDRDVRTLTDGAHAWSVHNPEAEAGVLGVEIVRGAAIEVDADFGAAGTAYLETFRDVAPYVPSEDNDAMRLVSRVEKVLTSAGAARVGVEHDVALVDDARVGGTCTALTATTTGTGIGWCAAGRRFDPPLDVSGMAALGLWVYGEQSGVTLTVELWDDADRRASMRVPVFFDGWRLHTAQLVAAAGFDGSRVTYLVLTLSDLPPGEDVEVRLAALRATPSVRAAVDLTGVSLRVGDRDVSLPVSLPPGGSARIDALGRLTVWSGGMTEGSTWTLSGGPLWIESGSTPLRLEVAGPAVYPGDVSVRTSRIHRIHPE